jgi:hypothetical protein
MKKINLVYFEKKIDQSFIDNVLTNSENVSIFIKKDGELFSNSKFSDSQKLEINMKCISLDQNFSNKLIELIHLVHEIIPSIKTSDLAESQDYSLQHKGKIEAVVSSLVNKFSYENKGLLEFVSLLLIRIARAHA